MKIYNAILTIFLSLLLNNTTFGCPCTISTTDERPFFEQYESENNSNDNNETAEEVTDKIEVEKL